MENIQSKSMWNDIVKFITIIVIVHLLFYCVDDYGGFFNESILKILLYTTIAIIIYYLIVTKLVNKYLFSDPPKITNPPNLKENFEKKPRSILKKDRKKNNKKVRFRE